MERKTPVDISKFRDAAAKPSRKNAAHGNEPATTGKLLVMPSPPPPPTPEQLRQYVDEYAELTEQFSAMEKRKGALRKRLVDAHNLKPEQSAVVVGNSYEVEIGSQEKQNKVTQLLALFQYLGAERFFAECGFTLKALEDNVPKADRDKFVQKVQTETRTLTVTKKFKAA